MSERDETRGGRSVPVDQLSYTDASRELDSIVEFFEQRDVDVDQIVTRLERATAIVDELDKRIRRTRAQVEQLVPRLEAVSRGDDPDPASAGLGHRDPDDRFEESAGDETDVGDDRPRVSEDAERPDDYEDGPQLF